MVSPKIRGGKKYMIKIKREISKLETEWGRGSEIEKNPTFIFLRQKALNKNPKEYKTKVL